MRPRTHVIPVDRRSPLPLWAQVEHDIERRLRAGEFELRLTGGREQVRAVVPTSVERLLLDIPHETAALSVERTGDLRGQPVEWRQTVVRGDRFSFVTDLSRPDRRSVTVFDKVARRTRTVGRAMIFERATPSTV